ncbi:hypothetical protein ACFWJT_34765 [Streptomyces sp. NPDC127069]|uniref:Uncharacterized protein n=1 Tax=Streptomyces racemochromogenes TaxID=67353 RepID=A0ABW7PR50_9ACTN
MDIIYASLHRRDTGGLLPAGEADEVRGALWAHARPDDALQHITVRSESERVDLLVYLTLSTADHTEGALQRVHHLLSRVHQASPLMRRRYLPPASPGR